MARSYKQLYGEIADLRDQLREAQEERDRWQANTAQVEREWDSMKAERDAAVKRAESAERDAARQRALAEEVDDLCERLMSFNPNSWISLQAQAIVSALYPPPRPRRRATGTSPRG